MNPYNENSKYHFSSFHLFSCDLIILPTILIFWLLCCYFSLNLYKLSQNIDPINVTLANISIIAFQKDNDPDFGESHILISKSIICLTE